MPAIGYVTRTEKGFKGNLKTLSIKAPIEIAHNANKTAGKQPDYLIFVEGVEVGAAWNRVSNTSGNEYVSLQLAAPEFGNSPPRSSARRSSTPTSVSPPARTITTPSRSSGIRRTNYRGAALRGGPHFPAGRPSSAESRGAAEVPACLVALQLYA